MRRQEILNAQLEQESYWNSVAGKLSTYQEDHAFLNRLKKHRFHDLTEEELRGIYAIARRGMETRGKLEQAISRIARERAFMAAEGNLSCGLKLEKMYERELRQLKELR